MSIAFAYIRLILFIGGVLLGIQIPGFVDQYGKRLEAHYLESMNSLRQFKVDAQKYFDGDMQKLIDHYRENGDPVFQDGGDSIQSIYDRHLLLENAVKTFKKDLWHAYYQALLKPVGDIQNEALASYSYSVKLDLGAIVFGLTCGLILALFGEVVVRGVILAPGLLIRGLRSPVRSG
jgi:hypothetical protein